MILRSGLKAASESSHSLHRSYTNYLLLDGLRAKCLRSGPLPPRVSSIHLASHKCERCLVRVRASPCGVSSSQSGIASSRFHYFQPLPSRLSSVSASPQRASRGEELTGSVRGFSLFATPMQPAADESNAHPNEAPREDVIVQYIVIRKDLTAEWPLGSVITQGCHAAVAAVWLQREDPVTLKYCAPENLDKMHKVTLEVKGEVQLRNLAQKLEAEGVVHKLWIEQPENYATCLATKPYYKSGVAAHFKQLKLCK